MPVKSNPDGKSTSILPPEATADTDVKAMVLLGVAPAVNTAGVTEVVDREPMMWSPAILESMSILPVVVLEEAVLVCMVYVLVTPPAVGFFMLVSISDLAPDEDMVPVPSLVMVAVKVSVVTEKPPSIPEGVPDTAVALPELNSKPDGKVTMILPSFGSWFTVVKDMVADSTVPAYLVAGSTLVEVSDVPVVNVLAVIVEAMSMV